MTLSEYGFFKGEMAAQVPADGVHPYSLNTPLFSDYAEKLRFIRLPEGTTATYTDKEAFEFPVGTAIIKTFYYYHDARKPEKGRKLLETRLLIHTEDGWEAWPYHWNEDQTEAELEVAGDTKDIQWKDHNGKKQTLAYSMPNVNQCKGCHNQSGEIVPIGPSARQLNGPLRGDIHGAGTIENQLAYWETKGLIHDLPEKIPAIAVWDDPATGSTEDRARAWLDINCAHCHNPDGPANTSGLFLEIHREDPHVWGIFKAPVAAGRGSGGRQFDIHPGNADQSILYYRIDSDDPGVMMPELGRKMIHKEGVTLIKEWINELDEKNYR